MQRFQDMAFFGGHYSAYRTLAIAPEILGWSQSGFAKEMLRAIVNSVGGHMPFLPSLFPSPLLPPPFLQFCFLVNSAQSQRLVVTSSVQSLAFRSLLSPSPGHLLQFWSWWHVSCPGRLSEKQDREAGQQVPGFSAWAVQHRPQAHPGSVHHVRGQHSVLQVNKFLRQFSCK